MAEATRVNGPIDRRRAGETAAPRSAWIQPAESTKRVMERFTQHGWQLSFRNRRLAGVLVVAVSCGMLLTASRWMDMHFWRGQIMTGWTLMGCLIALIALGVRRRLPILPLGRVSTWTQIHLYMGLFAIGAYVMHAPRLVANGWFEGGLSILFWFVSGSGVYGVLASRRLPTRLTGIAQDHRFDDVHWHRQHIAAAASDQIAALQQPSTVHVLGEFYDQFLHRYLRARPTLAYCVWPHSRRRQRLLSGLTQLDRYLDDNGRRVAGTLAGLIRRRDDLDYQYAIQLRLRLWVIFHATCSIALLVAGIVHAIVALRFLGS